MQPYGCFIGLAIKEIQDHLLGEIKAEDLSKKCLLEARKIESKIEERKLLGIKTAMTYDSIQHRGRGKFRSKSQGRGQSTSNVKNCKYFGKSHNKGNCPAFSKRCQNVGKITTSKPCASQMKEEEIIEITANQDKGKVKGRNFMK